MVPPCISRISVQAPSCLIGCGMTITPPLHHHGAVGILFRKVAQRAARRRPASMASALVSWVVVGIECVVSVSATVPQSLPIGTQTRHPRQEPRHHLPLSLLHGLPICITFEFALEGLTRQLAIGESGHDHIADARRTAGYNALFVP